jgi:predicted RecB family endonuclease
MKPSIRAARDHAAQQRIVEAAEALAERFGVEVPDKVRRQPKGTPEEMTMHQREGIADLLAGLMDATEDFAEVDLQDAIDQASDEEILALPRIGEATLAALREG